MNNYKPPTNRDMDTFLAQSSYWLLVYTVIQTFFRVEPPNLASVLIWIKQNERSPKRLAWMLLLLILVVCHYSLLYLRLRVRFCYIDVYAKLEFIGGDCATIGCIQGFKNISFLLPMGRKDMIYNPGGIKWWHMSFHIQYLSIFPRFLNSRLIDAS